MNYKTKFDFDNYGICLISANQIIRDTSVATINELNSYSIDLDLTKHLTKKFFHSSIIHGICESIISCKTVNKVVIYFDTTSTDFLWYNNFFNTAELSTFFIKSLNKYEKILPVKIFIGDVSLDYIIDGHNSNMQDIHILLNKIASYCENKSRNTLFFHKTKKFVEKYKLTYLSNKYFTTIKSKQLLYK